MKYVKAHKETLRPFKKEGGCVCRRKPGKYTASANTENTQKPCRYALARTSENETKGMPQSGENRTALFITEWKGHPSQVPGKW